MLGAVALAMAATGLGGGYSVNSQVAPVVQKIHKEDDHEDEMMAAAKAIDMEQAAERAWKVTGPQKTKATLKRRAQRKRGNASRNYNRKRTRLLKGKSR